MNLILNTFYRRYQSFLLSYAPTQSQKNKTPNRSILHINPINSTIPFSFRQLNPMRI